MRVAADFRRNKRGNVAVIFAIALLPLLTAIGCAVDYSTATRVRAKLQAAADAASVAALAAKSPGFLAATAMTGNGSVAAGVTDALNVFNGNMSGETGYTNLTSSATVTKTGSDLAAKVVFSAQVPVTFLKVIGFQTLTVGGSSSSASSLPLYLDFYLMLDVSGSMGLPSTNAEQTRLAAINPDNFTLYPNGCTFACHFTRQGACDDSTQKYSTNNYCTGYALSRTAGHSNNTPVTACSTDGTSACIQLRADAVGYAVQQLLLTANSTAKVANQFRIGLYPFIQNLYAYFPLTSSISGSSTNSSTINYAAANLATLLDTGANSTLGSGGTHFENAFPTMNGLITSVGTGGSWNNTLPYVFLVTDGAQNNQTQWNGDWSGNNNATVIDTSPCTTIKNRGVIIAVLYIPYQPIQNPTSFANNEDFAVNAIIPNIPPTLKACASPNFFFTANTPADITAALNAMFNQALVTAHITK
ncbi:pilus assembly protein TadG-related protein [Rhodopseudomonas sp.]|uniref:TadE/TadG family type IV pilus assembly protein n=1 Tax=Rhodopseudomonas sp. TaxID=1078 RepID=UPI0025ED9ECE|nr:pilus assembly protein TadG-related protein [Rhodopseudomonas sp.]